MSERSDRELEELRADIDRRSGEGMSQSAEEAAQAALQRHQAAQQAQGYEPITVWSPTVGATEDIDILDMGGEENPEDGSTEWDHQMPDIKTAETVMAKARAQGEPVFVFRAKDFFSVMILAHYAEIIEKYGPDDSNFHRDVIDHLNEFKHWQRENVDKVRYPD